MTVTAKTSGNFICLIGTIINFYQNRFNFSWVLYQPVLLQDSGNTKPKIELPNIFILHVITNGETNSNAQTVAR